MHQVITEKLIPPAPAWSSAETSLGVKFSDYDFESPRGSNPKSQSKRLKPAAVLIGLIARESGRNILLTQRTKHLHHHAGQISFPGGRAEEGDRNPTATALREAHEELGLAPAYVETLGCLDPYETRSGYLVIPMVANIHPGFHLQPEPFEVAEVFELPMDFVLEPLNRQVHTRHIQGQERTYFVFEYGTRYIWGATAGMLANLAQRLRA